MHRTRLGFVFVLALLFALGGAALAQQAEPPDLRQQQAAEDRATLDKEGVIDSALEVHAAHPDDQHGGIEGHLPPRQENVKVVGRAEAEGVAEGRIGDVNFFGDYAYLAAFREPECRRGGVYVFNIKNLAEPRQVGFIEAAEGTYVGEGVQIIHVDTPQYEGDVLIHNNEICGIPDEGLPNGGVSLVDVTNPKNPEPLAEGAGDFDPQSVTGLEGVAHQTHSAFAWDAGRRAYAVLVDNEEAEDVDIMDITDPRDPRLFAEYNLNEDFPQIIQEDLGTAESFLHDMIVKKIEGRWIMLLSYWDGGYVTLDVTDPLRAKYIADSDFKNPDPEALQSGFTEEPEGNAHQAEFSLNNNFIVAADEDFNPNGAEGTTDDNETPFTASQGSDTPQLEAGESLVGTAVYVGRACDEDVAVPAAPATGTAQIAVATRGLCTFTAKVANIEAAGGYEGIVIVNREGSDGCGVFGMSVEGTIPTFSVDRETGFGFFDQEAQYDEEECLAGSASEIPGVDVGDIGDVITIRAFFDGWGYVHLFKNGEGKLKELDTYAIPKAHDPRFAEGFGDLSVHEVAMSKERNDLAYFSYYAGGFRVAKIQDGKLVEVGSYIARDGNNFWGVQVLRRDGEEYVLASDRDYGLYIFEYIGRR